MTPRRTRPRPIAHSPAWMFWAAMGIMAVVGALGAFLLLAMVDSLLHLRGGGRYGGLFVALRAGDGPGLPFLVYRLGMIAGAVLGALLTLIYWPARHRVEAEQARLRRHRPHPFLAPGTKPPPRSAGAEVTTRGPDGPPGKVTSPGRPSPRSSGR